MNETLESLAPRIDEARRAGFSDDEIIREIAPSFPNINDALKQGFTAQQILGEIAPKRYKTAGEVATGAVQNLPSSFGNLVKNIYEAITSPVQTAKSVLDVGAGALQNVLPERFVQFVGEDPASREAARAMGKFFADRYGTGENLKQTIATDPAGVLADIATVLSGGAGTARTMAGAAVKTGTRFAPELAATGQALSKAANVVDPLALATYGLGATANIGGRAASEFLGMTTGTGRVPIEQAFRAGREGGARGEAFRQNLRGQVEVTQVLDEARSGLQQLYSDRATQYRSGMINIANDKTILDFNGIDNAIAKAEARTKFKGQIKDQAAFDALDEVKTQIESWKQLNPNDFHTPEGFDALKQSISATLEKLDPKTNAYNTVNEVYKGIKSEIVKQAPVYANVMSAYSKATDEIMEVEKALSLKKGTSVDTSLRKLLSTMRDNVNANFGQRLSLVQQLDKVGQGTIVPSLAGISLSEFAPRGLQRLGTLPTAATLGYFLDPTAGGLSLAASSPRVAGEAAYGLGATMRQARNLANVPPVGPISPFLVNPELYNYLYQAGQIQGQTE